MIIIKNLSKVYLEKNKKKTIALDNMNLIFPNKGLISVVGKSGCGK